MIDAVRREVIKTISFPVKGVAKDRVQPVGIKLTQDGRYGFVALGPANHVAVVDRLMLAVNRYLLVGHRAWHLALTADQKRLFTTNGMSNDVTVIDVDCLESIKSIKMGRYPWGIAIKP